MVCPWFSMTKLATATTEMRLVERGILDPDEPIVGHLPSIGDRQPAPAAGRITAWHLLTHKRRLAQPGTGSVDPSAEDPGQDPDQFLAGLLAQHPRLRFEPGTRSSCTIPGTLALACSVTGPGDRLAIGLLGPHP
jgi:CubicO group peptidase (beta-lactamase class C family)